MFIKKLRWEIYQELNRRRKSSLRWHKSSHLVLLLGFLLPLLGLLLLQMGSARAVPTAPSGISTLKGVPIPEDASLKSFVVDKQAAKVLGKALFWDMSVGSDGKTACASCHFHAGADVRTKNQLSPALNHLLGAPKNSTFDPTWSGNKGGPNYQLTPGDFPFFVLADPNDRDSQILFQTDDTLSSQGVFSSRFTGATAGNSSDQCDLVFDSRFHVGGISTRRVEPRNTPTTVNAIFNLRNFWDGRANETFNGVNPFGTRDSNAGIYKFSLLGLLVSKVQPNLHFASLASQASGPPLSDFEMACAGRSWPNAGRRLLSRVPLQNQDVAATDSLLSTYRASSGKGLTLTYQQLIDKAFSSAYRSNSTKVTIGGTQYTISEANFSFFFGLAVQLYESTLVSDNAPLDQYLTGSSTTVLTDQEIRGMNLFGGKASCTSCHSGPQLTNAGSPAINDFKNGAIVSRMVMGDSQAAIYDEGFYNIGVRPTIEDIGVGGSDPFGNPLSFAGQYNRWLKSLGLQSYSDKNLNVNPCTFAVSPCITPLGGTRQAVDGAFKVPTLRNVELTGPYFHNGSRKSLEEVVEFYNRGGDRRGTTSNNSSGYGSNGSNLDPDIRPLGLTAQERQDLVAFLKRPLTDNRVRCDQAPFDHPQLTITNGHVGNNNSVTAGGNGAAVDALVTIPAVGAAGMCAADLSGGRLPFDQILANGGSVFAANGEAVDGGELILNSPLPPDVQMLEAPSLEAVPVEEITIETDATIILEENVPAIFEEEQSATQAARIFLPLINAQK